MQEFTAVTAPTASGLADALNAHAADGWSLVQVVNAGHELAAILSRDAQPVLEVAADVPGVDESPEPDSEPVLADAAPAAAATFGLGSLVSDTPAVEEPAGWAAAPEPAVTTPEQAAEPALAPTLPGAAPAAPAPAPAPEPAPTPAVPSGWYADPSGRFELRYWDGGQWTEHVSRAGQQYTDPPVA
jgi:hypothetical protein